MPYLQSLVLYNTFTNSDFLEFQETSTLSCTRFLASQERENSARYLPNIDCKESERTSFPDQPFGLGDSWSAGKLRTFQALFSRPAEFGPYAFEIWHVTCAM